MAGSSIAAGRRERKKAQTRRSLVDAAQRLFLEHGYDQVTVAQIADEADTAVTTLFKHFPQGKEALIFGDSAEDHERAESLVAAVTGRGAGVPVIQALREFFRGRGPFEEDSAPDRRRLAELITSTPALHAYARRQWEACEGPLTAALCAAFGAADGDPAVHALARYVLQVPDLAGTEPDPGAALDAIFDRLEHGWGVITGP